jgi:hypothetical protein
VAALVFMAWAVAGWDETRYNRYRQKVYNMTNEPEETAEEKETDKEQEESDGTFGDAEAGPSEEEEKEEETK